MLFNILLLLLKTGPYARNARGMGIITVAIQASNDPAQCTPRFANICVENSGKLAATAERNMMLAATVEAALMESQLQGHQVVRQAWAHIGKYASTR